MNAELTWETLDWNALDRLRDLFLKSAPSGSYWTRRSDLANYEFTFARRIAWKWMAVLRELQRRGWKPPVQDVFDWGCGSGIAGRTVIGFFGENLFRTLRVYDQCSLASEFAIDLAQKAFCDLRVEAPKPDWLESREPLGLLVASHVLNELTVVGRQTLRNLIDRAAAVLWVEPGTYDTSRALIAWREELQGSFHVIAPCTHQAACGLRATEHE